jgi:hypothetical protein
MPEEDLRIDMEFRCHICGEAFEAQTNSFICDNEEGPLVEYEPEDDVPDLPDVEVEITHQILSADELRAMDAEQLDEIGMTEELRDMILEEVPGEEIACGAVALCPTCREAVFGKE